jgi:hypothetical protein
MDGPIGRQLQRMFLDRSIYRHLTQRQGVGAPNGAEVKKWWEDLRGSDAAGRFLAGSMVFAVSGTKARSQR